MFSCKYGYFSEDGYEYIITNPKTPKPWSNIISNGDYSILITQTGGGYSWSKNSFENRVTRFVQDSVKDDYGKYLYIRDDDTGEFWSFTYKPVDKCGDDYKVIYGLGYAIFKHTYNQIESTLKVFLSKDDKIEFYCLTLKDCSGRPRNISVFSYVEVYMSNFPEENREFDNLFFRSEFNKEINSLIFEKRFWGVIDNNLNCNNRDYKYRFFISSTENIQSYETFKEKFIGMYNSCVNPLALTQKSLSNTCGENLNAVGCIHISTKLKPFENKKISIYMGLCEGDLYDIVNKYNDILKIENEYNLFKNHIREFIDSEKIITQDKSLDFMVNIWCKYQTLMSRFLGKASYYQINKGIGFRDHIQDSMIFLSTRPQIVREQILIQAEMQFICGRAPHFFLDESKTCIDTKSSDDHLWLIYITILYINETNDRDILNCELGYLDSDIKESLYLHLKRGIEYSFDNIASNGLCDILNHDWNDGISNFKGQSVFVSEFLYLILNEFDAIFNIVEDFDFKSKVNRYKDLIRHSVNKYGFYKKWYLRCVSNDFNIGRCENKEGRIFLLTQAFAIMSDICHKRRKKEVMNQVYINLNTQFGLKILDPPYERPNKKIGYITRYSKGVRENGSIYYHSCMWGILAFILIDEIKIAEEIIRKINPINRAQDNIDLYRIEPYVMPSNVNGDCSEYFGTGNWSFNTGSSVWFYIIITRYIFGLRPTIDGLLIDVKPFYSWKKFSIIRRFRGAIFNIDFENYGGEKIEIILNNKKLEGKIIKDIDVGKTYYVKVYLKD